MTDRSHYRKTSPSTVIDVYRVLQLFEVADPCLQHAVKKLLAAGKRGSKDAAKDVAEAIESLRRWQQMRDEEAFAQAGGKDYNATWEAAQKGDREATQQLQAFAEMHRKASREALSGSNS